MAGTFPIGSIPPFSVWEGETLTITVTSKFGKSAKFSKRAEPSPKGKIEIDEKTGVLTYSPKAEDTEDIEVSIRAQKGADDEKQKVVITPHPRLPSDFNIIQHVGAPPEPYSQIYTTFAQKKNPDRIVFNNEVDAEVGAEPKIETKEVTISGVRLVFKQSNATYPLFDKVHAKLDVSRLTLCADEVIIGSPVELPGTNVHVYARRLVFEGNGQIITTPRFVKASAATRGEALKGQKAGDVYLYVRDLDVPAGAGKRIIAKGGNGQGARAGKRGDDGKSREEWNGHAETWRPFGSTYGLNWPKQINGYTVTYAEVGQWKDETKTVIIHGEAITTKTGRKIFAKDFPLGSNEWPTSGSQPKTMPGQPGQGGDGGSIFSSFKAQLKDRTEQPGGDAGAKAVDLDASPAGSPTKAAHVRAPYELGILTNSTQQLDTIATNETKPWPKVLAPEAPKPLPKAGSSDDLPKNNAGYWLHSAAVRALIPYTHDAMLAGHGAQIRPVLAEYQSTIAAALKPKGALTDDIEWSGLQSELTSLLLRIDSPNDYFGNPAGWVPMLSFDTNRQLYQQEIEGAIRTMFLAHWIEKTQKRGEAAVAALNEAITRSHKESDQALADYEAAQKKVKDLEEQSQTLTAEIDKFQVALKSLEKELQRRVKNDLQREHILRASAKVLGAVMQLVPLGQPALGAFGKGVTVLSDIDLEEPQSSLPSLAGAFAPLAKEKLLPKAKALFTELKKAKEDSDKDEKERTPDKDKEKFDAAVAKKVFADKVKKYMDEQKEAQEQVMEGFSSFAVQDDEVKERLAKVVADCPEYQEKVKTIETLNTQKAAFAELLLATMRTINECSMILLKNQLGQFEMRSQLNVTLDQLSTEVLQYAQGMGQRARERLLTYQYYVLKSYHYLMLEGFRGIDFRAEKLLDAFATMLAGSPNGTLTESEFKTLLPIFEDQLKAMVKEIVGRYQKHPLGVDGSFLYTVSKEQLAKLNSPAATFTFDLMSSDYLSLMQEGIRITEITTHEVLIANPPTENDPAITINLDYRHEGISRLRSGGRLFLFRSGDYQITANGVEYLDDQSFWGTNVQHDRKNQTVNERKTNSADISLIRHLIGDNTADVKPQLNYRPSAWADLTVRRTTTPSSYTAKLNSLILKIGYVSDNVHKNLRTVLVKTPDDLPVLIQCDAPDINGRGNGQGTFLRSYDLTKTTSIKLKSPDRYGTRSFQGWKVGKETKAGSELKLDFKLQSEFTVEPLYSPVVFTPTGDMGALWPVCPTGWIFKDWLVTNKSDKPITFSKIDALPWSGTNPVPRINDPYGNDQIKLSFDAVVLLPDESARVSVCTNPAGKMSADDQIEFEWQREMGTCALFFNGKGESAGVRTWTGGYWREVREGHNLDKEDRTLTIKGM